MIAVSNKKNTKKTDNKESFISINLCDGNKGGVGKSFLCRALYHWFLNKFDNVCGFEADLNSPDFSRIYDGISLIKFTENDAQQASPNIIVDIACEDKKHVVVNLPAGAYIPFLKWEETYNSISLVNKNGGRFIKWFVNTGEFDSIKPLEVSLKKLGDSIPHVVVNNKKYTDWAYFESQKSLHKLIAEKNCVVIDLPKMPPRVSSFILEKSLKLSDAAVYKADRSIGENFGMSEREAVRRFIEQSGEQFDNAWEQLS